jgi:hypothetical protein
VEANDTSVDDLLARLRPKDRERVLGTPLAADAARLLTLLALEPTDQGFVLSRLGLGIDWSTAIESYEKTPEPHGAKGGNRRNALDVGGEEQKSGPTEPTQSTDEHGSEDRTAAPSWPRPALASREDVGRPATVGATNLQGTRQVVRVPVSDLRPNAINATIYRESLDDERLRELADHIGRHGQQEPIIADASLMILDGERRWRALLLIGAGYADVIVDVTERSPEETEDLVLDAFSLKRKLSVFEQLRVYEACVKSYTRRYGRRAFGRPKKVDKSLSTFWDASRIKDQAAEAAGLGSRETARQAIKVIKEADSATKEAMLSRAMTISAAYDLLPKRPGKMPARDDSRGSLEAIGTGAVDAHLDEDDSANGTDDTSPDAVAPGSPAATRPIALGKSSPDAARPPSNNADGGSLSMVQLLVPAAREPTPGQSNVEDHLSPLPQGGDVADARPVPSRDLETGQERRAKHGGHGAANRAKTSPAPKDMLERALMEVETYGDGLAASSSDVSDKALDELVDRLNTMLARWASAGNSLLDEDHSQDEDDDGSLDEREGNDDLDDGIDSEEHEYLVDDEESETGATDSDEWNAQSDDDADSNDDTPKDDIDLEVARVLGMKRR